MIGLEDYRQAKGYFFSALLVTDVVSKTSLLLMTGSPGCLKSIGYPEKEPGVYELGGVISRKKQVLTWLSIGNSHFTERDGERPPRA